MVNKVLLGLIAGLLLCCRTRFGYIAEFFTFKKYLIKMKRNLHHSGKDIYYLK